MPTCDDVYVDVIRRQSRAKMYQALLPLFLSFEVGPGNEAIQRPRLVVYVIAFGAGPWEQRQREVAAGLDLLFMLYSLSRTVNPVSISELVIYLWLDVGSRKEA